VSVNQRAELVRVPVFSCSPPCLEAGIRYSVGDCALISAPQSLVEHSIQNVKIEAVGKPQETPQMRALQHNLRSEIDFEDEKNMAERAIGLLTKRYDSKMFSRSPNSRWVIYERYSFPCLIDTTTYTEELIGWSPVSKRDVEMPPWWFGGNSPIDQDEALWHPSKEAVALQVATSRRATNVWIWEHKYGLHKLQRSELIKLLQPKGKIDEPNPLTAEIKEWNGDDVFVSVGWGFEPVIGKAVVAWNLSQHKWRAISKEYHRKFEE
jgi:hypothetical protein